MFNSSYSSTENLRGWKERSVAYLSFYFGPAFLLFLSFSYVLVLLLSLCERLQELIEDAKELIWLHLTGILTKVLYCPQELRDQREEEGAHGIRFTAGRSRTAFYSIFDCFTGESLGPSSLKPEQGRSGRALKPVFIQISLATDCSWGQRLEPELKLRQCACWVFFTINKKKEEKKRKRTSRCKIMLGRYSFKNVTANSSYGIDRETMSWKDGEVCFSPIRKKKKKEYISFQLPHSNNQ